MVLYVDFLKARPDLLDKAKVLVLEDERRCQIKLGLAPSDWENFDLSSVDANFYQPITRAFTDVLSETQNLTILRLKSIDLGEEIIRLICGLHYLQRLTLMCCDVPSETVDALTAGGLPISSCRILRCGSKE
ncbi:hypothetical protein M422DRAFT_71287 [Sphaerobolus stellatus SS14]|uniref:Uncharacterized protein n=1 Tax=Sphaerobolus stellatus (strain SS14) TaxID=990650 RepID=A0A0C9UUZ8_SPHS4|nr:hypothetical protein M422DRAFT_71287 [Sphaerobolus stellatus SS14]